jgi:hypothetical protein
MKIINPAVGNATAAQTIVEILAEMLARERLKKEIMRKRQSRRAQRPPNARNESRRGRVGRRPRAIPA